MLSFGSYNQNRSLNNWNYIKQQLPLYNLIMSPPNDDKTSELAYGDSRDSENYHDEGDASDKMHKQLVEDTKSLGKVLTGALKERADQEGKGTDHQKPPPTKMLKMANGKAATTRKNLNVFAGDEDEDMMLIQKEGDFRYLPTKDMTGVKRRVTRLCAAISGQIYYASSIDDFNLSNKDLKIQAEVIMFETHTKLEVTTPPFVAVVMGKTLICGWRGSTTAMDWVMNAAFAPVASSRWIKSAKSVRVQGAYCTLIESALCLNEDFLIKTIKDRGIEELILTGHSLAGGLAQVAHLSIEGSRANTYSPWSDSDLKNLTVRSVAFSAPMAILNLDRANDPVSVSFVNDVGSNMCNIIYASDPVPRGYANVSFIHAVIKNAIPQVASGLPIPWFMKRFLDVQSKIENTFNGIIQSQADLIKIMTYFRHIGKVIHYEDDESIPVTYIDKGFYYSKPKGSTENLFYDIAYKESDDIFKDLGAAHGILVSEAGLAYGLPKKVE